MRIGENQDHIIALIIIDGETVGAWAEMQHMQFTGLRDLATKDEVSNLLVVRVREINANMEHVSGKDCPPIKRYTILAREFNVNVGELTRSYKIRRKVVTNNFNDLIDALYSGATTYDVADSSGAVIAQLRLETA